MVEDSLLFFSFLEIRIEGEDEPKSLFTIVSVAVTGKALASGGQGSALLNGSGLWSLQRDPA